MLKKLLSYLGIYKFYTILTPVLVICEVILEVYIPYLMSQIIDIGIKNRDMTYIYQRGLLMILMAFLALLFGALSSYLSATAGTGLSKNIRRGLFHKIQEYSFSNIDKFSTPSLVTRLTTDVNNTQMAFIMSLRLLFRAPFMLVFAVIMSVFINAELALIFLFAVPTLGISLYFIAKNAFPRFQTMLKKYDRLNAIVQENLIGIRVVKAFVRGEYEEKKFEDVANQLRRAQQKAEHIIIWNMPIMQLVVYACIIAIAWFGGNQIIMGNMETGELISFITYVTQILMSLMMLSMVFIFIVISKASTQRIVEVLDEKPDIINPEHSSHFEANDGSISFIDVSFSYGGKDGTKVLEDINLAINSGETVGILGGTGSSKTSLVQLIPRLYDITEGKLLVGGHDVKEYDLVKLRDSVAIVLQKNVLFSGTIKENLKWGNENATNEEIEEVCKIAQAHDFILSFPKGYNTDLGQGGVNLSGGQKQRISIARALLKKPKIIILDDSTSAVDTKTDSSIRHALKTNLKGTTTIIIAQRISSIRDADKIVIMDDGKISSIGTHDELLRNNEIYKEVYESQQEGADENAEI